MAIILAIDPGTRLLGYAVIHSDSKVLDAGSLKMNCDQPLSERLLRISLFLRTLIKNFEPQEMAIEKVFLGKNAESAFKLGHARGVCMQVAAENNMPVFEYAARFIKKSVVGSGAAEKDQVKMVVEQIFNQKIDSYDAADALAIALTHWREKEKLQILKQRTL